jgi:hypothetical protein
MWLSDISVKRPVFAAVIALLLLAFGALAFDRLAVREYPDISPPIISVSVGYPGASAEVVESRITQILESEVSGIEGVKSIDSQSLDGMSLISVEFSLKRDIDGAANDVRDRVGRVIWRLPDEVDSPVISKQDADAQPIIYLNLIGPNMSLMELTDYGERYVRDQLAIIPGVSQVTMNGLGRPSMRIWLDRVALAARNLTVTDVSDALRRENIELPAGRIESTEREFQIRIARNFETAEVPTGTSFALARLPTLQSVRARRARFSAPTSATRLRSASSSNRQPIPSTSSMVSTTPSIVSTANYPRACRWRRTPMIRYLSAQQFARFTRPFPLQPCWSVWSFSRSSAEFPCHGDSGDHHPGLPDVGLHHTGSVRLLDQPRDPVGTGAVYWTGRG